MKSSVFTLIFRDAPLREALRAIKRAYEESGTGMKPDASLWLKHQDKPVLNPADPLSVQTVADAYEEEGLTAALYFAHDYPRDDPSLELAMRHIDAAVKLGTEESLILCPWPYRGGLGKFIPPAEYYREVLVFSECIVPLADYASLKKHRLSFKPHCGLVADGRSAWEFAARFNHPAIRVCYDATNVRFYEGIDPVAGLDYAAPLVSSLCMKDHIGTRWHAEFPDPGKGEIDHRAVLDVLLKGGFNGPVVVEKVEGETVDEKVEHLTEVLRFVKSLHPDIV